MCGIAGFFYKEKDRSGPIGRILTDFLITLGSRGVDGTGVALYDHLAPECLVSRVFLGGREPGREQANRVLERLSSLATITEHDLDGDLLRVVVRHDGPPQRLADTIEGNEPDIRVFSLGRSMEVVKDVGNAARLDERYCISAFQGTHAIGHTRLATESRVDVAHCHPFWARPFPDISVVHNGQITNYHKMRRVFEMQGWHFATENDSEIIALYIAHKLADGVSLEDALRSSLVDLDGSFTYLIATSDAIGFARDAFATKPLLVAECDEFVALASEEVALYGSPARGLDTWEPPAKEVRVWMH